VHALQCAGQTRATEAGHPKLFNNARQPAGSGPDCAHAGVGN
jgi:hypothetical protein